MGKRGHHVGGYDLNSHFSSYATSRNTGASNKWKRDAQIIEGQLEHKSFSGLLKDIAKETE